MEGARWPISGDRFPAGRHLLKRPYLLCALA